MSHKFKIFKKLKPDYVLVLKNGKIVKEGNFELIEEVEREGGMINFKNNFMKKQILLLFYLIIFSVFWIILAINPIDRFMWFIENFILIIFLIVLIISYRYFKFSNISYTLILIFCIIQIIGAHYTYTFVPMDWMKNMFNFSRNNYDRIAHFSFGLFLAFPFSELFKKTSKSKNNFWVYYFPIEMAFGVGAIYEIIEWIFAIYSSPLATVEFLGSQGDIWDAQKDMFLAGLGATFTMFITFIISLFRKK